MRLRTTKNSACARRHPLFKSSFKLIIFLSFLPLLESEEAEDRNDIITRLSTWSLERLQQEGYCLTDLSAYWCKANQFGKPVAAFHIGPGIILPEIHKFECVHVAYIHE